MLVLVCLKKNPKPGLSQNVDYSVMNVYRICCESSPHTFFSSCHTLLGVSEDGMGRICNVGAGTQTVFFLPLTSLLLTCPWHTQACSQTWAAVMVFLNTFYFVLCLFLNIHFSYTPNRNSKPDQNRWVCILKVATFEEVVSGVYHYGPSLSL